MFKCLTGFQYSGDEIYDRRCKRCGLIISIDHIDCPHCHGLSDSEMVYMLNQRIENEEGNSKLGYIFSIIGLAIVVFLYFTT